MAAGNNIIGEVGLKVVPVDPAAQFQAGVDQIIKRLEKQAQFQIKASGLENVEQQANVASQAFANAAIQAAGLTAAIYGIRASVEGAINKLSGLFDQLAQARAGFTSILHSEAAGGKLLDDIREFARVSPFVTQELVNYSQQLLGVGLSAEKIIPLLKSTGDIISSVGGDTTNLGRVLFTLTQIKSIGALKGQDTMQLQNSLIPITKYLSDYLHKSSAEIVKLREDGKITADVVFAALNQQGEKVQGAMDRATRNIAGARAILSDTITQLFQNQPVLNKIFKDVFTSIANLANKLGEAQFQQAFAQFFDGVNKVYEGLRPLLAALGGLVNSGIISGLQVFGTTLGVIGSALSAIPKGVMEAFARLLLALGALKAPLLLISYITNLRTMASAILPATKGLAQLGSGAQRAAVQISEETAALQANTAATQANAVATGRRSVAGLGGVGLKGAIKGEGSGRLSAGILAGSVAAEIGGGFLSQSNNSAAKTAGGALQGGGIGAQLGSLAGPWGAGIGAVLGGALGGITAWMGQAEAKAKKHIEEMKKLGVDAATEYIKAEGKTFGVGASGGDFLAREAELRRLTHDIEQARIDLNAATGEGRARRNVLGQGTDERRKVQDQQSQNKAALEALTADTAAAYDPLKVALGEIVAGLDKGEKGYELLTTAARGHQRTTQTNLSEVEKGLKKYGFTLADLNIPEKREQIVSFIRAFDGLTTAQQKTTLAAAAYNTTLIATKAAAAAVFDPEEAKIQSQIDLNNTRIEAEKAALDITSQNNQLNFQLLALKEKEAVQSEREAYYLQLGYEATKASARARIDGEQEYQRILGLRGTSARDRNGIRHDAAPEDFTNPATFDYYLTTLAQDREKADKAKKDAEAAAKKAAEDAASFADKVKSATGSLVDKLQSAADEIANAAERWVGSIKERTQYEQAVSAGTAIKNTERQIRDLTELTAGLNELRARGLTEEAIKALGIDNVNDVKQVRKLLRANPGDLSKLSGDVSTLNSKAVDLATAVEDKRTQNNIRDGIIAAATTLGIDLTRPAAAEIASTFHITTTSDAEAIASAILFALSGGKIGR